MGKRKSGNSRKSYWFFASLRLALTFLPQAGYIHPDEFFQNVEVLAGRAFEYEASLPWEFNTTSPIRSIGISYLTIGFSYQILKLVNFFVQHHFHFGILTPYTILVVPRLVVCLLSYLIDYTIYKICVKNNEKSNSRLLVLATSYVTLVYCTHTFTNTLEVILFALLLHYVADSMIFSNIVVRQREYLNNRYNRTENPAERAKFHKLRLFLASDSYRNCIQISTITVLGFFNRPTFLAFALFPVFFWLYRGIGYKSVSTLQFNIRILALVLAAIPTILVLIIIDSFFYGYITWGEIGMLDVSIDSFVFPPLNFIKYNIDSHNLAKHGLHPRYMHVFINIPLLFNILGVFTILGTMDLIKKLLQRKFNLLPTVRSIKGLMTMSYIAPTFFLSFFPHQEPRFLLPIVIPLVYLYAHKIYDEESAEIVKASTPPPASAPMMPDPQDADPRPPETRSTKLFVLWTIINLMLTVFYGFLHQGGVVPAATHLAGDMHKNHHYAYHVVTSHMYSIPHVLFQQPDPAVLRVHHGAQPYQANRRVFTHETGSLAMDALWKRMQIVHNGAATKSRRFKMYLLMTATKHDALMRTQTAGGRLRATHVWSFYPHFSGEALPDFSELVHIISVADVKSLSLAHVADCLRRIASSFSVNVYEVHLAKVVL